MGTPLTGLEIRDTYDALLKITDNGPLSGTAKYLSDGLGNDSALALSTGDIGIGTTSPSRNLHILGGAGIGTVLKLEAGSGAITYLQLAYNGATNAQSGYIGYDSSANMGLFTNDTERMRITSAGNVGIGTSAPLELLHLQATSPVIQFTKTGVLNWKLGNTTGNNFVVNTDSGGGDVLTLTTTGNVGIGTSAPLAKLQSTTEGTAANEVGLRLNNPNGNVAPTGVDIVFQSGYLSGNNGAAVIRGGRNTAGTDSYIAFQTNSGSGLAEVGRWLPTGGLTFNGDTAAANALDDYEEGTFTCTVNVGSGSVTVDTTVNQGRYTKIGNVVSVQGRMKLTAVSSPSGNWSIDLPFTVASYNANGANEGVGSCVASNIDFGTNTMISAIPDRGSALCFFIACGDNSASIQLNGTHLSATSDLFFQTTYITA
jgi:hypothetical protein